MTPMTILRHRPDVHLGLRALVCGVLLLPAAGIPARAEHQAVGGAVGATPAVQSPETRVTGVVLDASGAPVPGATVIVDVAGARAGETTTGADGRFAFAGLAFGEIE
ncbi:MAG: carboxypeptidase-like regulatory domain-containing protein, partial [Acidobacteriota bacterium]